MILKAVERFKKKSEDKLPKRVIVYRSNVGNREMSLVLTQEIKVTVESLALLEENAPKLCYMSVTKLMNDRFMTVNQRGEKMNPSGVIVGDEVTSTEATEFFLIA